MWNTFISEMIHTNEMMLYSCCTGTFGWLEMLCWTVKCFFKADIQMIVLYLIPIEVTQVGKWRQ